MTTASTATTVIAGSAVTTYWCERAWLPEGIAAAVRVSVTGTRLTAVDAGVEVAPADVVLRGLVLPGFANAHSHAFHRALRGRTHLPAPDGAGSFWTWRRAMYDLAEHLTPQAYGALATALYAEMALAGVTAVGEFHYLHHDAGGRPYGDPNLVGRTLREAARTAGIRLTLLDTCYLETGDGAALTPAQQRFSDGSAAAWAARVDRWRAELAADPGGGDGDGFVLGAAIHSVRAVPPAAARMVADWAREHGVPLHVHLSEQPAENAATLAAHGATPTAVLHDAGAWGPGTTAVHANHVSPADVALLGAAGVTVCACPGTERDLGDGTAPNAALAAAGARLCVGSDQHVAVDLLAEARGIEEHERLAALARGVLEPASLVAALTRDGHRALGRPGDGVIAPGARADLVALDLTTPRTAGTDPAQIVMVATGADVTDVVAGGALVVAGGRHRLGDVGAMLAEAIDAVRALVVKEHA